MLTGSNQLITGPRSYLTLVVFISSSGELFLGPTRSHISTEAAPSLVLEDIRGVLLIKNSLCAVTIDASSKVGWAGLGWRRGVDCAFSLLIIPTPTLFLGGRLQCLEPYLVVTPGGGRATGI